MIPIFRKLKYLKENENIKNLDKIGCDYITKKLITYKDSFV